jgi:hypothetical protein
VPPNPFTGEPVRHLAYYVYPVRGNGVWQRCLNQLKRRLHVFNGHRVIAVAVDAHTDSAAAVWDYLHGYAHEVIELPNDPRRREAAAFLPLLERTLVDGTDHVLFWGHAKGVTRPVNEGTTVHRWTDLLLETCLDYLPLVDEHLQRWPVTGSCKKIGRTFSGSSSRWHYSGGMFWLRCQALLQRDWRRLDRDRWWASESWPGLVFGAEEAGCLFLERPAEKMDLYEYRFFQDTVLPEFAAWKSKHLTYRSATGC